MPCVTRRPASAADRHKVMDSEQRPQFAIGMGMSDVSTGVDAAMRPGQTTRVPCLLSSARCFASAPRPHRGPRPKPRPAVASRAADSTRITLPLY